ncbi:adhesion G protein-coupled receptor L2-like isoform X2 [Liolophura sinensis]|uniref:adhesion G protein-coupled receptor L2-like isoform X2 n=1 Tax=Liolophura sinensis TaxID=3198878 RepID=UPI0031594B4B
MAFRWDRSMRFSCFTCLLELIISLLLITTDSPALAEKTFNQRNASSSSMHAPGVTLPRRGADFLSKFFPNERTWLNRPKDQRTAYACEKTPLQIECDANKGEVIRIIRANYGRFSITICNPHGVTQGWNLQCMSLRSLKIVSDRCDGWTRCKIVTNNDLFGDPCPDTYKYLQVQYRCAKEPPPSTRLIRTTTTTTVTTTEYVETTPFPSPTSTIPPPPTTQTHPPTTRAHHSTTLSILTHSPTPALPPGGPEQKTTTTPPTPHRPPSPVTTTTTPKPQTSTPKSGPSTNSKGPLPIELTFCKETVRGGQHWPTTNVGIKSVLDCPGDLIGVVAWECGRYGWVGEPDDSGCKSPWLQDVIDEVKKNQSVEVVMDKIEDLTSKNILKPTDLKITTSIMNKMAERLKAEKSSSPAIVQKTASEMVQSASNLLAGKQRDSWADLDESDRTRVATSLVITVEDAAFAVVNTVDTQTTSDDNIFVEVNVIKTMNQDLTLPSSPPRGRSVWADNSDSITIPKESLQQHSQNGKVSVVFIAYNNLAEWMSPGDTDLSTGQSESGLGERITDTEVRTSSGNTTHKWAVNTKIISTSLNERTASVPLTKPVTFVLQHTNKSINLSPKCCYWNYSDTSKLGHWAEAGCRLITTNQTHTTCECDHLTNFAVLMDVAGTMLPAHHELPLQVITYAGCLISIFCLILAFITFFIFKNLQCDRNTIHKNLVLSLLIAESIFLAGIQQSETQILCAVIAGLLHFFFLASFAWMCLEGIQLYVMLIEVFEAEKSRVKWYYLFGYGLPAIIVGISAAVDHQGYGTERHCWLRTDTYFIWSFVGPVAAVITVNIVMLSIAVYMMCRHATTVPAIRSKEKPKMEKYRAWIKGAAVLVVLLGLTWSFGILYINENTVIMAYLFTILNSLQGLFIFVFHCLMNEKVQKEYRKVARRTSWLPDCIRVKYGGYTGYSQSTTPNQSTSSGGNNYFSKLWSGRKRKKSTSSLLGKSNSSPSRRRQSNRPNSSSHESTVLTPISNQNGFIYTPGQNNGHQQTNTEHHSGINGDLSVVDCSVVDSEFVSEYCQENMKAHKDTPQKVSPYNADESIYHVYEEPMFRNKKPLNNSDDSIIKNRLSFMSTDTKDGIHYSEVSDEELFRMTEKEKRLSEYEREPLVFASKSERQLISEKVGGSPGPPGNNRRTRETSPSLTDLGPDTKAENDKNLSTPNLKYKETLKREVSAKGDPGADDPLLQPQSSLPNLSAVDEEMERELSFGSFDASPTGGSKAAKLTGKKVTRLNSDAQTKHDPHRFKLNTSSDC